MERDGSTEQQQNILAAFSLLCIINLNVNL